MPRRLALVKLATIVLALGALLTSASASELTDAKKLLRSRNVEERRQGVRALIDLDSRASILPLEEAVRRSRKAMRQLAKEVDKADEDLGGALGLLRFARRPGQSHYLSTAIAGLKEARARWDKLADRMDANLYMGREVGAGFARLRSHAAIKLIEEGARSEKDGYIRQLYVQALGAAGRRRSIPILLELLTEKDPRVRAAAVRALRPFVLDTRVMARLPALAEDPAWSVRLGMYETVARAPLNEAVPCLVTAAVGEEGQMAATVDGLLHDLTGHSFVQTPQAWAGWFAKNKASIEDGSYLRPTQGDVAQEPTRGSFFRIPIPSKNVLFAIDFSGSMTEPYRLKDERSNEAREDLGLPETRLGVARAEAVRAIRALPDGALFNVVIYGGEAKQLGNRPLKASKSSRRRAEKWILKQKTLGLTNIWDALRLGFGDHLANASGRTRFALLPDTIVFLTDGFPTRGRFQRQEGLRELVRRWNASAGTVIHTIGIGENHSKNLLGWLAADSYGIYVDLSRGQGGLVQPPQRVPFSERRPNFKVLLKSSMAKLKNGDQAERVAALRALATMGAHAAPAANEVAKSLDDVFEEVAREATEVLVSIGPEAVPHIVRQLDIDDVVTVGGAIDTLARLGPDSARALPRLTQFALDPKGELRVRALKAIAAMGPAAAEAEEALKTLCEDPDTYVKAAAEKALSEIRDG